MNTKPQSEREFGPWTTMYMLEIGKILTRFGKNYTFGDLNPAIDQFLLQEKRMAKLNEKKLAHTTRQTIYEVLLNKQMELKSI